MKLLTAEQMRELDRRAIGDYGVPGVVLMENAGRAAAQIVAERYRHLALGPVVVVAGKGNNGGDGYVMARHLENAGWQVRTLVLAARDTIGGDAQVNLRILENCSSPVSYATDAAAIDAFLQHNTDATLVIDAIFGNGLNSQVRGHYLHAIKRLNTLSAPRVAVDIPSGVDATSGTILGAAIQADCTIAFAAAKLGQVNFPAQSCGGELFVVDIGMPRLVQQSITDRYVLVDEQVASALVPRRAEDEHKGGCGHTLVIAGSVGKSGAAQLCAAASARSGSGLVTLATPAACQPLVATAVAEIMTVPVMGNSQVLSADALDELQRLWTGKQVVALGPGLGLEPSTMPLVTGIVTQCKLPLVLDADGLNAVQGKTEMLLQRKPDSTVLTPHPGEMARLSGLSIGQIQHNRCEVAARFARQWQVVVVLKGARTVVAAADGRVWINSSGNSGMASGGMGDVLTGVIAAWLAQGLEPFVAAVLGVFLHAKAADRCACQLGSVGYLAGDLLQQLPAVRQELIERG